MKTMVKNLRRLIGRPGKPWHGQPYQARCLTPEQMSAVNWCDAQWFHGWQREAGIKPL
jgi:hypothetical protein